MICFKIDDSEEFVDFAVGNAGIIPKKGELVTLTDKTENPKHYDVIDVKYYYHTVGGTYLLKNILVCLSSI